MLKFNYCLVFLLALCAQANAHFLWIVANPDGKNGEVHAYFSETALPDDPKLLEKLKGLKVVALSSSRGGDAKRQEIELQKVDDALVGTLPEKTQSPLSAAHTYGVMSRGGDSFLLKYYAKAYPSVLPGNWKAINNNEVAEFEITPRLDGEEVVLTVTWQGKPVAGDQVTVEGPGVKDKIQGDTNAEGQFRCKLPGNGLFSIRSRHMEKVDGKLGEHSYTGVRHYASLSLPYTQPGMATVKHSLPELPRGMTSFGGAILDDNLYVYGGHLGGAHSYSTKDQSNDFRRLSLKTVGANWETLPSGPKLTGLALVAHNGKLYRVGGFTVKNEEKEDQNLWSQDSFAQFDPRTGEWTDLPSLPEPRSSHDAVVLDGKLYVAGGWNMQGSDNTTWHTTAWSCDLNQPSLTWTALPAPSFERRALSLAAYQGKIYVLGGMQKSNEPSTVVDMFDPATQTWSKGPALNGFGLEGFGNSSFAIGDRLIATTMSGSLQQLNSQSNRWDVIGQLAHPRFFHRQLVTSDGNLLVVGGASMQIGKTNAIEIFKPVNSQNQEVTSRGQD